MLKEDRLKKEKMVLVLMGIITFVMLIGILFIDNISQDKNYHNFSDSREMFKISNFWNVVSNLPYFFVGIVALYKLLILDSLKIVNEVKVSYILFFVGVGLVAFGSTYYHLDPNNETLLWDRLPMSVAFMALFSLVVAEFFSVRLGKVILIPLLLVGIFSVLYWFFSELRGVGDLRAYILVQFLPMLLMPMIFLFFKASFSLTKGYWLLLLCYLLAKVFEYFDTEVYELLGFISGHSLKHMISALGVYVLLVTFEKRYQL